ncbi:MAG: hypothetical protein HGN29_08865 [Asgard group archaeon]|nr:hypothetical protein [Asgard group archaeon]
MIIDDSNNIHIVWQDYTNDLAGSGSDVDIFYMNWDYASETWSSFELVSTESTVTNEAPRLAIDSLGNIHVVWTDYEDVLSAGSEWDVFYNKLVEPPEIPILAPFTQNPAPLGDLSVDWSDSLSATDYDIYREEVYIWSISSLTPIASVTTSSFFDTINETGTYYYSIVAKNDFGESDSSNVNSIVINDDVSGLGFFKALRMGEILVLAGILGGFQIILSVATFFVLKTTSSFKKSKK